MRRVAVLAAAVSVAAALGAAPTAEASRYLKKGVFDDTQVLFGNPDNVFPELAKLKTQVIRANLWWGGGPSGWSVSRRRPVDATDPDDRSYDWSTYDRTVQFAARHGIKVVFSIVGTPPWANRARGFNVAPTRMDDLRRFAIAAAARYDGTWKAPDGTTLPAVKQWLAWNEPNNPVFLKPQFVRRNGRWIPQGAYDYAKMCNAVVTGVKAGASRGRPLVACGVTAPRGNNQPGGIRASLSPLAFLRAMKTGGATGFDAYAHHPYPLSAAETPSTPPPPAKRGAPPTAVTLGNIDALIRELTRLYGNKRVWITEYGYQTNPPDTFIGVTPAKQAAYMRQAWNIARKNPRIDLFLWFLMRDEARLSGWQSGMLTARGTRKPSYAVFPTLR